MPDRWGEVSARLHCFSADSNDAVAFTSVSMMETEEVKLSHSETMIWLHLPNTHITNHNAAPPPQLQSAESTQWNSNHKHNPTRTNQRHSEWSLKWPLLSNPLGDDLWNVKERNQKPDLKLLNRTLHKSMKDYSQSLVCVCIFMWAVHKQVYGLLSTACRNLVGVRSLGMNASVPSCTAVWYLWRWVRGAARQRDTTRYF